MRIVIDVPAVHLAAACEIANDMRRPERARELPAKVGGFIGAYSPTARRGFVVSRLKDGGLKVRLSDPTPAA